MRIVIPTLDRIHEQKTYNSLPDKYKKNVTFVVQAHEYEEMKSKITPFQRALVNSAGAGTKFCDGDTCVVN